MNQQLVDSIVRAILYEGYILYPYRRSTKNQQRWTFGCIFPADYSHAMRGVEPCHMQTQCLLKGSSLTKLSVQVRFLHIAERGVAAARPDRSGFDPVDKIEFDGKQHESWQEAIERTVLLEADLTRNSWQTFFLFPAERAVELLRDARGQPVGQLIRTRQSVEGVIHLLARLLRDDIWQLTVRIENLTPMRHSQADVSRDQALPRAMASTHAILCAREGEFISLIDPPAPLAELARACNQQGAWPVLVGEMGERDAMLASPIILYDYPQIAPESPGDLFDGTEIDEILSLRILTLTDDEKQSAKNLDPRSAALLKRTEGLARQQLAQLHGTMRSGRGVRAVHIGPAELRAGDRVLLRPRGRADAFDAILRGRTATIAAIEQDYENRIHLAVTIDDDPGADIGAAGQIGHRFYFRPEDVEPLNAPGAEAPT